MKHILLFCLFSSVSVAYTMEQTPRNNPPGDLSNGWSAQPTLTPEQWAALIKNGKRIKPIPEPRWIIKQDGTSERIKEEEGCGCIIF